eukprot:1094023-Rhodomonas_salina.2
MGNTIRLERAMEMLPVVVPSFLQSTSKREEEGEEGGEEEEEEEEVEHTDNVWFFVGRNRGEEAMTGRVRPPICAEKSNRRSSRADRAHRQDQPQVALLLLPYACAMRCPVLPRRRATRALMSGTNMQCMCYAMSGTDAGYLPTRLLCDVQYWYRLFPYASAMRCLVLAYAISPRDARY